MSETPSAPQTVDYASDRARSVSPLGGMPRTPAEWIWSALLIVSVLVGLGMTWFGPL